jgi:hypothetical protein
VTNGGWRGMNGAQRRILLGFAGGFLLIVLLILVANAESTISDLAASGVRVPGHLVWSWEWSSMIGWLSLYPALWWAVARVRPPRFPWGLTALALALGSLAASAWHIAVMVAIRHVYYAAVGAGPYRFFGIIADRLLYEYRKDLTTYLQFVAIAAVAQWLLARAATPAAAAASARARTLAVSDGPVTHHLPVAEIERVIAAGNYVEIAWRDRTFLHRATLTAVEAELGSDFVRIHRGQIVRRDAIRRVETDKAGDFTLQLASGATARGSRRYRAGIETAGEL